MAEKLASKLGQKVQNQAGGMSHAMRPMAGGKMGMMRPTERMTKLKKGKKR
tara:strand:- start:4165 stop:4317 length:153 start_codon:yes stop_codon:yes gene_type:complete